jgi:hypothetical protein
MTFRLPRAQGEGRPAPLASHPSVLRRMHFANNWRYRLDRALLALGLRRSTSLSGLIYALGNVGYDVCAALRDGPLQHPGRAHVTALREALHLPQDPRYRGYWYDGSSHSLVGLHLGLDLNYHRGQYYLLESNTNPAMRPERRLVYDAPVDPMMTNIASSAKAGGFEQVLFIKRDWAALELEELARASEEAGIPVVGMTVAALARSRAALVNPIMALPERLKPRSMYVISSPLHWAEPICHFVHEKTLVSRWLLDAILASGTLVERLACVPSYDRPVLNTDAEGCWPNMVVKLASTDKGKAVVMARFDSTAEAERALGRGFSKAFQRRLGQRLRDALSDVSSEILFQPFIPPEVIGGRARLIRLHLFISPLCDVYLSAHGVCAGEELPDRVPNGVLANQRPYLVNYSSGARYCRLEPEKEQELTQVAREFGLCARRAIAEKFQTGPQ